MDTGVRVGIQTENVKQRTTHPGQGQRSNLKHLQGRVDATFGSRRQGSLSKDYVDM